jgi:glycosyltransferase involved in cell wall biosynthesis
MLRITAILITAYNRANYLEDLLDSLHKENFRNIHISVDCNENGEINSEILALASAKFSKLHWIFRKNSLGPSGNLPTSLNELFESYDNCVVLEDDIQICPNSLRSLIDMIAEPLPANCFSVGLFGALPYNWFTKKLFGTNRWRETSSFSGWGWATQRESWKEYEWDISAYKVEEALLTSKLWTQLPPHVQKFWLGKFKKVAENPEVAWDYQMQFKTYLRGASHLLPTFRSIDNIGFNDVRSSNTTAMRPRWYLGKTCQLEVQKQTLRPVLRSRILGFVDRLTWIGGSRLRLIIERVKKLYIVLKKP